MIGCTNHAARSPCDQPNLVRKPWDALVQFAQDQGHPHGRPAGPAGHTQQHQRPARLPLVRARPGLFVDVRLAGARRGNGEKGSQGTALHRCCLPSRSSGRRGGRPRAREGGQIGVARQESLETDLIPRPAGQKDHRGDHQNQDRCERISLEGRRGPDPEVKEPVGVGDQAEDGTQGQDRRDHHGSTVQAVEQIEEHEDARKDKFPGMQPRLVGRHSPLEEAITQPEHGSIQRVRLENEPEDQEGQHDGQYDGGKDAKGEHQGEHGTPRPARTRCGLHPVTRKGPEGADDQKHQDQNHAHVEEIRQEPPDVRLGVAAVVWPAAWDCPPLRCPLPDRVFRGGS